MGKMLRKMREMALQTKLFLAVSLLMTILLLLFGTILNQIVLQNTRKNWDTANQQIINTLSANFSRMLWDMNEVSKHIHTSAPLHEVFQYIPEQEGNYFDQNPLIRDKLLSVLYGALGGRNLNGQIMVVSRYGDYIYVDNRPGDRPLNGEQLLKLDVVQWGLTTEDFMRIFLPDQDLLHDAGESMLTLARPLRTSWQTYGVILYSIPLERFNWICDPYLKDSDSSIALVNRSGNIFYEYTNSGYSTSGEWYVPEQIADHGQYDKGRFCVMTLGLEGTDAFLVQISSLGALRAQFYRIQITLLCLHITLLICGLLSIKFIIKRLTLPLEQLRSEVDQISLDGVLLISGSHENNEIQALREAISEMVQRFREQNERLLLAREYDMKSRLNAMEAQLNSHFLYNTLAVIGAVGQMEGSRTVPRLCAKLAKLLRYSVDYNFKCVTLQDEFNNVRDYLEIMETRYTGQTNFIWEICPDAAHIEVPKLILQPIVENCFKHSFHNYEGVKQIKIINRCDAERWSIQVRNNGEPMTPETIDSIYTRFAQYREELSMGRLDARDIGTGFGLGNTVLRLFLFYKGDETFRIMIDGTETVVEIGGPIHER